MKRLLFALTLIHTWVTISASSAEYRELPLLTVTPETIHPLPLGFTSRALLPSREPGKPPHFLIGKHGRYFAEDTFLYSPVTKDGRGKHESLPADFPIYEGVPFEEFSASGYLPIHRPDGSYDLFRVGDRAYLTRAKDAGEWDFKKRYTVQFAKTYPNGKRWLHDLDGDGIVDMLVGVNAPGINPNQVYPDHVKYGNPWHREQQPNSGQLPDTDRGVFRGYDIAGNWLGVPVRRLLLWTRGKRVDGKLSFGTFSRVRYGRGDYPVQWATFGFSLHPVAMDLENGTHIILLGDNHQILSLPVAGERDGLLHTGPAGPLLASGTTLRSVINPGVVGVADMNGDGHDELVIGSGGNSRLTVLAGKKAGAFTELGNVFHRGGAVTGDTLAVPVREDWDGDGRPDLIIGDASGHITLRRGTDDSTVYDGYEHFRTEAGAIRHRPTTGNLQGDNEKAWSYLQPEVHDWDRDGNPDILANDNTATLYLYRGEEKGSTRLAERERFLLGEKPLPIAWRSRPAVIDRKYGIAGPDRDVLLHLRWNGHLALAIPTEPGSLTFAKVQDIKTVDDKVINLSGPGGHSGRIKLSVADWDGDGDWDIVAGVQEGLQRFFHPEADRSPSSAPYWLENTATSAEPRFAAPRLITWADGKPIRVEKHSFTVYPTDLDDDGTLDIIFGDDEGFFFHLYRDQLAW